MRPLPHLPLGDATKEGTQDGSKVLAMFRFFFFLMSFVSEYKDRGFGFFFNFSKLFVYLCLAVLGLCCCAGFSLVVVRGLLTVAASCVVEPGL